MGTPLVTALVLQHNYAGIQRTGSSSDVRLMHWRVVADQCRKGFAAGLPKMLSRLKWNDTCVESIAEPGRVVELEHTYQARLGRLSPAD